VDRPGEGGEEIEIVGFRPTMKKIVTAWRCSEAAGRGDGGDNIACCCGDGETTWSGAGREAGSITPHTKFKAEVYVLTKEEGGGTRRSSTGIAAVLHPDDGRDGSMHLRRAWR